MKKMMLLLLIAGCAHAADDSMDGIELHQSVRNLLDDRKETEKASDSSMAAKPHDESELAGSHKSGSSENGKTELNQSQNAKSDKKRIVEPPLALGSKIFCCIACKKRLLTDLQVDTCPICKVGCHDTSYIHYHVDTYYEADSYSGH